MHENNMTRLSATDIFPDDLDNGSLVGRLWVQISSTKLGALINTVTTCDRAPPWEYGVRALTSSLAARWLV